MFIDSEKRREFMMSCATGNVVGFVGSIIPVVRYKKALTYTHTSSMTLTLFLRTTSNSNRKKKWKMLISGAPVKEIKYSMNILELVKF
jgi:hypothetical protein